MIASVRRAAWAMLGTAMIFGAAMASLPAQARPATYDVDIPAESLNDALQSLALALHHNLLYSPELVVGKVSQPIKGRFTAEEAVKRMLSGTNLSYKVTSDGLVLIRAPAATLSSNITGSNEALNAANLSTARSDPEVQTTAGEPAAAERGSNAEGLEEVVVTGSHIRGVRNDTAPMMTFDREYIERSGYSNMMQLVESLPVDFSGGNTGGSEMAAFGRTEFAQNLTRGTGFNLRGLGSTATLTLINGRRVAPSSQGEFVDVSNIPLAAIDRIEILTDGASAVYGADAVAGVVNIVLRRNFEGAGTTLEYGQASSGDASDARLSQTLGTRWSSGDALLIADLHARDPLDARDRSYIVDAGSAPPIGPTYLLPKRRAGTLLLNLDQTLPDGFDLSANVLYSHENVHQAQTYDFGTLYTNNPITNQESAVLGLGYKAFGDWRFELDGSAARVETVTDLTYLDIPSNTVYLLTNDYRDKFDTWSADLKGDGSLFSLRAGKVRLAVGASFRDDRVDSTRVRVLPPTGFSVRARDHRNVKSGYAELFVPIVGKDQNFIWARRIDLSVAARYDNYSDFGSTTNPKVGLVWSPIDSLDLRATYGTSFRAPTVAEKALVTRGSQISTATVDAPGGGGEVPIFYELGSAALSAEKSREFTAGFSFRPIAGAEFSANYFNIDYRGRISEPPFEQDTLSHPSDFGDLLTPIASDAAAQAFLDSRIAAGDLYIDYTGTGATGVRYIFDLRQKNAARTRTSGVDVTASYALKLNANSFDLSLNLTHINKLVNSLTATTTSFDQINTYGQPLKTRARAMATWLRGGWNSTLGVNFSNSYTNPDVTPYMHVDAWTTVDLNAGYAFGAGSPRALQGCKVSIGALNLFNKSPPYAVDPLFNMGFDVFNANALGRFVTGRISKRW